MSLRIKTPLPDEFEDLIQITIGAALEVHTELGPGLLESIYARALAKELKDRGIAFEIEVPVPVYYKGEIISHHRVDLMVEGRLVIEAKAVERLAPVHVAQVLAYLRLTGARIGLLMNFNTDHLRYGIRRVIL
jgi:GxxExxY protein